MHILSYTVPFGVVARALACRSDFSKIMLLKITYIYSVL